MNIDYNKISQLANTIRILSAEAVQKANSGHPGMPMGAADYAAVMWGHFLNFNPKDVNWINRDRFVLSAGHGSMLQYSLLHLFGFDLSIDEIKNFRQWGSKTPGHPEYGYTVGVETTTGPLGQGFANGVGLALSAKMMQARYGEQLFNHKIYGIVSDGDLMEGVASEAASIAGHLKLGNIIYIYDDNKISIGGSTDVCFTESVPKRFESYGWHVQSVDGHDPKGIAEALNNAVAETGRPSIICAKTKIGFGSPKKAGTSHAHGEPLGAEELAATKAQLGWKETEEFKVPSEVGALCCALMEEKVKNYNSWQAYFKDWSTKNPEKSKDLNKQLNKEIPAELLNELIAYGESVVKPDASRNLSGNVIQILAKHLPGFAGGSADLEPSNKTLIKDSTDITHSSFSGKNIRFGVREHAMGSMANGLAYTQFWFPYTATFLVFADYMRPTVRLAALSHLQTLFIFTHDSFWVGEDGPTHQPIEQIMSLRLIPNLYVFRPADGLETALAYYAALTLKNRPSTLLFTRQNLDILPTRKDPKVILKGGYVLIDAPAPQAIIVATGSEVGLAVKAHQELLGKGINTRVVSMPCVELFNDQSEEYRESVLPSNLKKVSIEAGTTFGWDRIVGSSGLKIGIDHYESSAPGALLAEKFGFSSHNIVTKILNWING